jgi:hypothetical protein
MLEKLQLAGKIIIILKLCKLVSIAKAIHVAFLGGFLYTDMDLRPYPYPEIKLFIVQTFKKIVKIPNNYHLHCAVCLALSDSACITHNFPPVNQVLD